MGEFFLRKLRPFASLRSKKTDVPSKEYEIVERRPLVEDIKDLLVERYSQVPDVLDQLGDWIPESELPNQEYTKFIEAIKSSNKILFLSHNDGDGITSVSIAIALARALNPDIKIDFFSCPTGWSVKQWKSFLSSHMEIVSSVDTTALLDLNDDSFFTAITELSKENNFKLPNLLRADHHNKKENIAKHFTAHVVPKGKTRKEYVDSGSLLLRETYRQAVLKGDLEEIPYFVDILSLVGLLADGKDNELSEKNPLFKWKEKFDFDLGSELGERQVPIIDETVENVFKMLNLLSVAPVVPEQLAKYQKLLQDIVLKICLDPSLKNLDASKYMQIIERYSSNEFTSSMIDVRVVSTNIDNLLEPVKKRLFNKNKVSEFEETFVHTLDNTKYIVKYVNAPGGKRLIFKLDLRNQNEDVIILDAEEEMWKKIFAYVKKHIKDADLVDVHFHTIRPDESGNEAIVSRVGKLNDIPEYRAKEIANLNSFSGGHDVRAGMTLLIAEYGELKRKIIKNFIGEALDILPGNKGLGKYGVKINAFKVKSYEELEQLVISRADAVLEHYLKH